jgi:hypothetical protein
MILEIQNDISGLNSLFFNLTQSYFNPKIVFYAYKFKSSR